MPAEPKIMVDRASANKSAAAIAIFAFKRLAPLQRALLSLGDSGRFVDSPLYVFSDAPREDVPGEAVEVAAVRRWLRDWSMMHGARMHEAATHRGLRASIISGVTGVLDRHDRIIVLEDDLIVSRALLPFMNDALEAYRERDDIMQVSGYFVPHEKTLAPIGLLRTPGSWGWATWKRAWNHYNDDAQALLAAVRARNANAFDMNGSYGYLGALQRNAEGTLNTWAVRWYASIFLRGGMAVYPAESLTRNIGFGEEATNCAPTPVDSTYMNQRIARQVPAIDWETVGNHESAEYAQALESFYRWQQGEWAKPTWRERAQARWELMAGGDTGV